MSSLTFEPLAKPYHGDRVLSAGRWVGTIWFSHSHGWQWARLYREEGLPWIGGACSHWDDGLNQIKETL